MSESGGSPSNPEVPSDSPIPELSDKIQQLPALPKVYQEVRVLASSRSTDAGTLTHEIEKDPALSGRVLKLANSAIYSFRGKITSLHLAVSLLGNNNILALTSSLVVMRQFRRTAGGVFQPKRFWEHGRLAGCAAVELNEHYGYGIRDDIFTFGLLHDIGKIAVYEHLAQHFERILNLHREGMPYRQAERKVLGADHTVIGALIAQHWRLPEDYEHSIRYHHSYAGEQETLSERRMFLVYFGNVVAHMAENRRASGKWPQVKPDLLEQFSIDQEDVQSVATKAYQMSLDIQPYLSW